MAQHDTIKGKQLRAEEIPVKCYSIRIVQNNITRIITCYNLFAWIKG